MFRNKFKNILLRKNFPICAGLKLPNLFSRTDATNLAKAKARADSDYYAAVKASEANKVSKVK